MPKGSAKTQGPGVSEQELEAQRGQAEPGILRTPCESER